MKTCPKLLLKLLHEKTENRNYNIGCTHHYAVKIHFIQIICNVFQSTAKQ